VGGAGAVKVNPEPETLATFHAWILDSGLGELTAQSYVQSVRVTAAHPRGVTGRLTAKLAPLTLHSTRAALRAYATFTDDGDLLVQLKKIRLPAARRVTPKVELEHAGWKALVAAIMKSTAPVRVRAPLLIMALRGLRVGDVLRLERTELVTAVKTGRLGFMAKGRRRLDFAVTGQVKTIISQLLAEGPDWPTVGRLLCHRSKDPMKAGRARLSRALKAIAKTIDLEDVYNHRLRRTYATHFVRKLRGDPQAIMKLQSHMGWASPTTAMGYVDAVNTDELDAIGEILVDEIVEPTTPKRRPSKP
jgi:integrase